MKRDGSPFISGSEPPRPFGDVLAERPVEAYQPPAPDLVRPIDEAPPLEQPLQQRANVGHRHLKERR